LAGFEIEDGVPIPARAGGRGSSFPIDRLKVGQSFFVPGVGKGATLRTAAHRLRIKVTIRERQEKGVFGARIWRIE
jgi:hypothetical protein